MRESPTLKMIILGTLLGILGPTAGAAAAPPAPALSRCDVLVYGGTPGGIAAAIAASRGGARVVLVEPTQHVGGLVTSGLSHTDFRTYEGLNGLFLDFARRVEAQYQQAYGAQSEQVRACRRGTQAEPHVNERVFEQMLSEQPSLTVRKGLRLSSLQLGETPETQRTITRVTFTSADGQTHEEFAARVFVDATYEGDLMARAGVKFRVGREGRGEYDESLAPEQADSQLQAYNFRLIMTQDPALRVTVEQPEGYRREDFAAILPLLEDGGEGKDKKGRIKAIFDYPTGCVFKAQLPALPNGKYDINDVSAGIVRLSLPGQNLDWPEGDASARARVFATHLRSSVGLLWFLQNDPAVPEKFHNEARAWGWCRDEFTDNGHLPWQLYVREARRMVGARVFTERNTEAAPGDARSVFQADAIAMGDYGLNCHGTAHEGPRFGGRHAGEFYKRVAPYQIPYGVLVPRDRDNLLVPVACSASHVGFCALRLEPIWMALGQAAGVAARIAIEEKGERPVTVAAVPVPRVQRLLHAEGAATTYVADVPPGSPSFAAVQWIGARGGLHGLVPAGKEPGRRGRNIEGQYYEAFPGHAFEPDRPVDDALLQRWIARLDEAPAAEARRTLEVDGRLTRGEAAARLFALAERETPRVISTDVCVYGGTSGGVVAAVQAARMGKRVVLAEPGGHLGGMSSGGLGWTDFGGKTGKAEIGGLAREFYRRVGRHYGRDEEFTLEPHVAERVFDDWVKEAGVTVLRHQRIASVEKEGKRVRAIFMEDGTVCRASMFLDTTYEGDLMARAGISHTLGREANSQYDETLNGQQRPATNPRAGKFEVRLDPYVRPGDPASGLLPLLLQSGTLGEPGTADRLVQSYNYRVCLTDREANKLPLTPADYDPADYELLARWIEARAARGEKLTLSSFCKYDPLPNGKFDFNNRWPISTDYIGGASNYPEASFTEREAIARRHEDYLRGFFHFLATSQRVPETIRREMQAFGLCKDEFVRHGGWPHQLYVREARRLVSDFVMTQHHCQSKAVAPNPAGLAAYGIDIHAVRRIVHEGQPINEGSNGGPVPRPYPIAYASLVPKAEECENLFITFCLSASHVAFASIRMEPVFMVLSQSAATAACQAIDQGVPVQDLPYDGLRARLLADGQVLAWPAGANSDQGRKEAVKKAR